MAIEFNLHNNSVDWIVGEYEDGHLNTSISIQRGAVWNTLYKSYLIVSMLSGISIGSLWLEKEPQGKGYKVVDGQNRIIAITQFINNEFTLSRSMRNSVKFVDGEDVGGKRFSQLSNAQQKKIRGYQVSIVIYNAMTELERATVFFLGNQAVKLSFGDLLPVSLGEDQMVIFDEICSHPFFTNIVVLGQKNEKNREALKIVIKYFILLNKEEIGLSGSDLIRVADRIGSGEIEVSTEEILPVLDYLCLAFADYKSKQRKYFTQVHLPTVIIVANEAREIGMDAEIFASKMDDFFMRNNGNQESRYYELSQRSTADVSRVRDRLEIMREDILGDNNV